MTKTIVVNIFPLYNEHSTEDMKFVRYAGYARLMGEIRFLEESLKWISYVNHITFLVM